MTVVLMALSNGEFKCSEPRDYALGLLGFVGEAQVMKVGLNDGKLVPDLYI